jgi:hypothetical protein
MQNLANYNLFAKQVMVLFFCDVQGLLGRGMCCMCNSIYAAFEIAKESFRLSHKPSRSSNSSNVA